MQRLNAIRTRARATAMAVAGIAVPIVLLAGASPSPAAAADLGLPPEVPVAPWTPPPHPARPIANVDYKNIVSPVGGPFSSGNDFGAPRNGGRQHAGNDLFGSKMERLVAAVDGVVGAVRTDAGGLSGNMLIVTGRDGWKYVYMHLNNDTPGTDDGANRVEQMLAPGIGNGSYVRAGQFIAYMGDSGNAEDLSPHVHFEIRRPDNVSIDPFISIRKAQHRSWTGAGSRAVPAAAPAAAPACTSVDQASGPERKLGGYVALGTDGGVFTFGDATGSGSLAGTRLNGRPVGIAATPGGKGYWVAAADGGVFAFGDAPVLGSIASTKLNGRIVGITPTPTGTGYWLAGSDGGVFAFGDAPALGSMGSTRLGGPVVGIAATPTGRGYWLASRDGGVFAFGDAQYLGGANSLRIATPIRAIAAAPSGIGYWLLGADGGVFAFGNAPYSGSLPGLGLCDAPQASAIASSPTGHGYWLATADGRTWPFGDAPRIGSVAGLHLPGAPGVVAVAVALPVAAAGAFAEQSVVVQCSEGGRGGCAADGIAGMLSSELLRSIGDEGL